MGVTAINLDELLTPGEAAEYLGTTAAVLAQDRYQRRGLPYVRLGRRIRYRAKDIAAYIDANTVAR
jgi:excisionase family DNA binding protein